MKTGPISGLPTTASDESRSNLAFTLSWERAGGGGVSDESRPKHFLPPSWISDELRPNLGTTSGIGDKSRPNLGTTFQDKSRKCMVLCVVH